MELLIIIIAIIGVAMWFSNRNGETMWGGTPMLGCGVMGCLIPIIGIVLILGLVHSIFGFHHYYGGYGYHSFFSPFGFHPFFHLPFFHHSYYEPTYHYGYHSYYHAPIVHEYHIYHHHV
ncbi:hypothetical protein KAR50_06320 [Periweissella fabaria]|uniref:hypothetical protein n=1 Tax=Periweissella fabaria TaxID=546157 RepID=UPI001E61DA1F|nr:hypothetical protein [Periweissella fabaria]MCM0597457.1 hypothetical protein [Periweissella fabaria]